MPASLWVPTPFLVLALPQAVMPSNSYPYSKAKLVSGLIWITHPWQNFRNNFPSYTCLVPPNHMGLNLEDLTSPISLASPGEARTSFIHTPRRESTEHKGNNYNQCSVLCLLILGLKTVKRQARRVPPAQVNFLWHLRNMGNKSWHFSHIEENK